ncbi:MAG: MTH1187 family thiamine-binding protein [Actinobacteria bacterium]|nr:MTH1187 family thiamine-binding protein [Actinomycetota bacterium]
MLAAFSISPGGVGESVGDFVAEAVRIVRASGLRNRTSAMFTEIEGDWPEISAVIGQCIDAMERRGAPRVSVVVKVDHRPGHHDMLDSKVASVEGRLSQGR